ncbi:alpha-L-rhamnosidase [Occallatibacter savannae]|uniref:alpha-L-rhamnosidase n=1 Tax=Occallatibacter savannae TaxID=1002691 RepID=UPI000D689CC5|nr:alpha-L-rhamnosidase [Occallatibacter savannae]
MRRFAELICLMCFLCPCLLVATSAARGPVHLQVDNLDRPLGIDDAAPRFSWQLSDGTRGAKQTAYRVTVATRPELLAGNKVDVWDSGKVTSGQSLNVKYVGPALKASARYFWRVSVWGANGKQYPASGAEWWETGLMSSGSGSASAWTGAWIGWETPEEAAERKAPAKWIANPDAKPGKPDSETKYAYRVLVDVDRPVKQVVLFATAEDTVSAWVNGQKVLTAAAFPPYHHLPWKKFVRADVTGQVAQGKNTIAIESVHYIDKYGESRRSDAPPMIATVVVLYADGTSSTTVSDANWKTAAEPASGWETKDFDDAGWKGAVVWEQKPGPGNPPVLAPWIPDSVKELRKEFDAKAGVKSARLYATALGTYQLFLNGKRVGDSVMAPGWTDYREHVPYQTYDVTGLVRSGGNVISALLAPGWYSTALEWLQQPNNYGNTPPALRAQLRIEHQDGRVEWVATDETWKAGPSYIVSSELYDGERQDLRIATPADHDSLVNQESSVMNGALSAVREAETFQPAQVIEPKEIAIEAQDFEPIRVERTIAAVKVTEPKPGVFIYDFGQNMAGVEKLSVAGPAGTDVQVRAGEVLNPDGTLYTENLRTAKVTDHFILSGHGEEELVPQFTFHGFRYVEVSGLQSAPKVEDVKALVLHTAFPFTAELKTGSTMINKLWSNILWGQRSNFVGVPTDCPQRDERLGWSADAQVFWRAASYNADLAPFSRKFAADLRGTQVGNPYYGIYAPGTAREQMGTGAAWSDAGVIIPWTSWIQTGDTLVVDENWAAMRKYVDGIETRNPNGIWHVDSGVPFGDWLSLEGRTKEDIVATAYWAYDVEMMRQMAHATGRAEEEEHYAKLRDKIREAFQKKFVEKEAYIPAADNGPNPFGDINNPNAKAKGGDTQTGYVLALHMNLLPDDLRSAAADRLVKKIEENHGLLNTGFVGTPYLLEELTRTGHKKLAYDVLLNTGMPSWGYVVEHGGTTTWERWNGDQMTDDPQMNSYNHYAYGAVADWIYRYAAGIDTTPLEAGFHTVALHPVFDARLSPLEFRYQSSYGEIMSGWTVNGDSAEWNVTLPANTTGRLELTPAEAGKWKIDGGALSGSPKVKKVDGGFELPAGTYRFEIQGLGTRD